MKQKLFLFFIIFLSLFLQGCNTMDALDGKFNNLKSVFDSKKDKVDSATNNTDKSKEEIIAKAEPVIPAENIWKRIVANYKFIPKDNKIIQQELKSIKRNSLYIERLQYRAMPYLYFIMNEIEKRGLPSELALLPAVESAFKATAHSSADAVGLWQFIPETGRQFKLKSNWYYDGRLDFIAATRAALDYLTKLNKLYDGDWDLTLAAYNLGTGNLNHARKKNRRKKLPTDYWSLNLNPETRHYVPRLRAYAELFAHPEKYNIKLVYIPDKPAFSSIENTRPLRLDLIAKKAKIDPTILVNLNPAYYKGVTPLKGNHPIHVPIELEDQMREIIKKMPSVRQNAQKPYTVSRGDTLSRIATRFHVNINSIKALNNIAGNRIHIGQKLAIPSPLTGINSKKAKKAKKSDRHGYIAYEVQGGDSLWSISKAFSISHQQLVFANNLTANTSLKKGQIIYIPDNQKKSSSKKKKIFYTVKDGDSLYLIAKRFSIKPSDIRRWNKIKGRYLKVGLKLTLYV